MSRAASCLTRWPKRIDTAPRKAVIPMAEIIIERHGAWAEIIFNRPERRNAINLGFAVLFRNAMHALNAEPELRAIVLSGSGGAFCSGLDLKEFNVQPPPPWRAEFGTAWDDVHMALMESPKVLITAVQGGAINGGAALALAGDLTVCGRSAYLLVGEAQFGMPVPRNVSWLVLKHGEAVAMRFALLAERVGADDLLRLGVATEVVDDTQVLARARAIAERIGSFPAQGVCNTKAAIRNTASRAGALQWYRPALDAFPNKPFAPAKVA